MKELTNCVAVVTGAASGTGRALSKGFLEAGRKVVLSGENQEILPPPQDFLKIYQEMMSQSGGQ